MIPVDTGAYAKTPYMWDHTPKIPHTHVIGPNIIVSTLSGKPKVKTALKTLKLDYMRKLQ